MVISKYILWPLFFAGLLGHYFSVLAEEKRSSIEQITSREVAHQVEREEQKRPKKAETTIPGELKVHSLGLGLGQTFLQGDFKKNGRDGITPDIYYNYSVSYSFDLSLNFHYSKHSLDKVEKSKKLAKEVRLFGSAVGIKAKLYQIDSFHPFLLGGFGIYRPSATNYESSLVFGVHLAGGGELRLNRKWSFGMIGHFHNPFDVRQKDAKKEDLKGYYFKLLITTFYRF